MTTEEKAKAFADDIDQLRIKYGLQEVMFCIEVDGSVCPGLVGKPISGFMKALFADMSTTLVKLCDGTVYKGAKRRDGDWESKDVKS